MYLNDNIMNLYNTRYGEKSSKGALFCDKFQNKTSVENETKHRICVGLGSLAGVAGSLAILSKCDKSADYSFKKMFKGKFKDSYLMKSNYKSKEIISMGAGSIIGGLIAGAAVDKKENFNAKLREGLVQISNISVPIVFVEAMCNLGKYVTKKTMGQWSDSTSALKKTVSKLPPVLCSAAGLIGGMYTGNRLSNKINEKMTGIKDNRPIKLSDFSAHIDDICVAATLVAENNPVSKFASRFIPAAILIPGYEAGNKREEGTEKSADN